MVLKKNKNQTPLYEKQVMLSQKGARLEALILLDISHAMACYSVSTREERTARHGAERHVQFLLQVLQSGTFFFGLYKQILKYCMLCIMA